MITGKNYIGNTLDAKGTITFKTFNPLLNLENDTIFTEVTTEEIDLALQLATSAFSTFKLLSGQRKAEFLNAIADEILALGDNLIHTYCSETGLPNARAKGERGRTIGQLRMFADLVAEGSWVEASIDTAEPERQPIPKPDLRKILIPLGPVVVFGASNFPLAYSTAGGDTAAALAAGCPVIVKSHPMHAGTGEMIASAVIKAVKSTHMPNGVFSNLNSAGIEVGEKLVKHPQVKAIGFTGSINGGRSLYDLAAKREEPIPVFAEMGSINPVIILPKALKQKSEYLARTYANSITLGTGQFCTNPGLILAIKSDHLRDFIERLSKFILDIAPSCMLHPHILRAYDKNKEDTISQNFVTTEAHYSGQTEINFAKQAITAVDGNVFLKNPKLHKEVFGPFSMIVECEDEQQLSTVISELEGQLTGTLISENDEARNYPGLLETLKERVGRIIFNGVPTGVEVCPSMTHGGPYPASTDSRFTAVGIHSIKRWVRPFSYQDWPNHLLPDELKNENPLGIKRLVNNKETAGSL